MWTAEEVHEAGFDEFVNFLDHIYIHLGLPEPTQIQKEIAWYLQYGDDEIVLEAFRGAGKTWITAIFALWNLFLDPQYKILIVSASQTYGDSIATFIKRLLDEVEILAWLQPKPEQRHSAIAFDVGPAIPTPTPSVSSVGIGGQLTGKRPDLIISDDVEVPKNSFTHLLREKLREQTKEYAALRRPKVESPNAKTVYLGTPQVEDTLYEEITKNRGYQVVVWPSRVPAYPLKYKGRLGPEIQRLINSGAPPGTPTEPKRFDDRELLKKWAEMGNSQFALQMMLDPSPADADRFPLKTSDLIVTDVAPHGMPTPIHYIWSSDPQYVYNDLISGGLDGDVYRAPAYVSPERSDYHGTVMAIDPSGRGRDETAYAILRYSQGLLYLVAAGAYSDGTDENTLRALAATAVRYGVTHVVPEANWGDGMFGKLLKPVLVQASEQIKAPDGSALFAPQLIEDYKWAVGQKEVRILDVLEPLIQNHKLVVDKTVLHRDMDQMELHPDRSLIYQMTRITRDKGSLGYDDRIEALAMGAHWFVERMARDQAKAVVKHNEELRQRELRKFLMIHKRGGVLYTDHRIGMEQSQTRGYPTIHHRSGNTPFNLNQNRFVS